MARQMILFFKAQRKDAGGMGDLFDKPILHAGHTTKTGTYVAPFVEHHKVRGEPPGETNDVELGRRGKVVFDYVGAVLSGASVPPKLPIGRIGKVAAERLSAKTGLAVDGAVEVVVASNVVHANKGHPDMTSGDWERLPYVTNRFDDAAQPSRPFDPRHPSA